MINRDLNSESRFNFGPLAGISMIQIDICVKTLIIVRNEMENIDGRILNDIEPKSCGVYLLLTKLATFYRLER